MDTFRRRLAFKGILRVCHEPEALLVADEVQSDFGRTGRWFGHEQYAHPSQQFSMSARPQRPAALT
jgi:acetylornithine/succinyldiaminopimelate/putrescine aminotransferase